MGTADTPTSSLSQKVTESEDVIATSNTTAPTSTSQKVKNAPNADVLGSNTAKSGIDQYTGDANNLISKEQSAPKAEK